MSTAMCARHKLQVSDQDVEPSAAHSVSLLSQKHHHFDVVEPHQPCSKNGKKQMESSFSFTTMISHDCNDRSIRLLVPE